MKRKSHPFKWRHFEPDIILMCVRWYCRFQLSYRDLEEMMRERGLDVHHSTVWRWVQAYAPEINKRIRPHLKMSGTSYRVDETYILRREELQISVPRGGQRGEHHLGLCCLLNAILARRNASSRN